MRGMETIESFFNGEYSVGIHSFMSLERVSGIREEDDILRIAAAVEAASIEFIKYHNYWKAADILKDKISEFESSGLFQEDNETMYRSFKTVEQFLIFAETQEPQKNVKWIGNPIDRMYSTYGSVMFELRNFKEARIALEKSLFWNPVDCKAMYELSEVFKISGDLERFKDGTMRAYKYAHLPEDIARAFRNMGFYAIEKRKWQEAVTFYTTSILFDNGQNSGDLALRELQYIAMRTGKQIKIDGVRQFITLGKYGMDYGADKNVLRILLGTGTLLESQDKEQARYILKLIKRITFDPNYEEAADRELEKLEAA